MITGPRADASNSVPLAYIPFSLRCQPWSPQSTMIVFRSAPVAFNLSNTGPY